MRIAYVSTYNSLDIDQWSGLGYYMCKSLSDQGINVVLINCSVPFSKWIKLKARIIKSLFGRVYQVDRDPAHLKRIAALAKRKLADEDYDLVLSPGSLPISFLQVTKPIIFWTDATYNCLVDFYPGWTNLSKDSLKNGNRAEQLAINKASLVYYTSKWARNNALEVYGADPLKVKEIPFGSNLEGKLTELEISQLVVNRSQVKTVNLLFVGVDWKRKGGDLAIRTVELLRKNGIDANLTVIGCSLPVKYENVPFIESFPFISKNTQEGIEKLNFYYKRATFFLLPTRAECFGVVFAEASSFGLPVITSNVGGCTSAVLHGINGFCLNLNNFPEMAREKIMLLLQSSGSYEEFSFNSYRHFRDSLNWKVIGEKAVAEIRIMVKKEKHQLLNL
ncbi:MAG: glycosyltransferase family 4 protein [Chitinophagaceae bacterium]